MFIYFSGIKTKYSLGKKGQIAPFLIAIIAVVIMAIMITVNLGKIGYIKTHVSNTGDAGALAGASIMASAFDNLAYLSSVMMSNYYSYFLWVVSLYGFAEDAYDTAIELYTAAAAAFAVAGALAITACIFCTLAEFYCASALVTCAACMGYAAFCALCAIYEALCATYTTLCTVFSTLSAAIGAIGCAAGGSASPYWNAFRGHVYNMYNTIGGAWETQRDYYNQIRKTMIDWIKEARDTAYEYAMANSGLKSEEWADGQGRKHSVAIDVDIQDIQSYELYTTIWPKSKFDEEWEAFDDNWFGTFMAFSAGVAFGCAGVGVVSSSPCTAIALFLGAAATIGITIGVAENSVWPHVERMYKYFWPRCNTFTDTTDPASEETGEDDQIFIAVRDVEHDRKVTVSSTQHHDGADLGLWQATYPDTSGGATATFESENIILEMDCHKFGPGDAWIYTDHEPRLISTW